MIGKDLKKLSRRELVDIIYQMKKNEEEMQKQIDSLQEELKNKRIKVASAGTLADAAVDISQLLNATQTTADLYLEEIAWMKSEAEAECIRIIAEAKQKARQITTLANEGKTDG